MLRLPPSNSFFSLSHLLRFSPPIPSFTPGRWEACLETVLKIFSEVSHILINSALLSEVSRNKFFCLCLPPMNTVCFHSDFELSLMMVAGRLCERIALLSGNL